MFRRNGHDSFGKRVAIAVNQGKPKASALVIVFCDLAHEIRPRYPVPVFEHERINPSLWSGFKLPKRFFIPTKSFRVEGDETIRILRPANTFEKIGLIGKPTPYKRTIVLSAPEGKNPFRLADIELWTASFTCQNRVERTANKKENKQEGAEGSQVVSLYAYCIAQ